jgi:hypothetical protein
MRKEAIPRVCKRRFVRVLGSLGAALAHCRSNCPEQSLQDKDFDRSRCHGLSASGTCILWTRRKVVCDKSSELGGVGCMRVDSHSLREVLETGQVIVRNQLVRIVGWILGHELYLCGTEPILEAGLAECMPAIGQADRRPSMDAHTAE